MTPTRRTVKQKIDLGNLTCQVPDCATPRGIRNRGFTQQGLANHTNKKHRVVTPWHEVVDEFIDDIVGVVDKPDTNSFMDDIVGVVDETSKWVTPKVSEELGIVYGWYVKGRNACCSWTQSGKRHGAFYKCKGDFVINPNLTEETHQALYKWPPTTNADIYFATDNTPLATRNALDNAPVASLPNEGGSGYIRIKARGRKLYVELDDKWQEMSLEQFINNVRFAINIS